MPRILRRRFLYALAGSGAGLAAAALLRSRSGGPHNSGDRDTGDVDAGNIDTSAMRRVKRASWALGSKVTMTALHRDPAVATSALDAAFAELETVEQVMSIYRPESQLSRLNREGVCDDPHPYFVEVLQAAATMSERTHGGFDVTIQPLWQAYWQAHADATLPTTAEITAARRKIDWRRVDVTETRIRLDRAGTAITLNGIAQGYAADRATTALRRHGIEHALIDTGEFGSLGAGAAGDGWRVGIQHPRDDNAFVAIAQLAGRCLATSGDYATRFDETFTTHHLLDPRTGRSASELASVSIVANSGLAADALSTATFVLGLDAGQQLVAATPGADALFVTKEGRTWASPGFPAQLRA